MYTLQSMRRRMRTTLILLAAGFAACLLLAGLAPLRDPAPVTSRPTAAAGEPTRAPNPTTGQAKSLTGEEARAYLERDSQGQSLMRALAAERFGLKRRDHSPFGDADGGGYLGMSHDENLNVWFDEAGATIRPTVSEQERGKVWRMGMRLKAYGYGVGLHEARAQSAQTVREDRIEYERGGGAGGRVVEWYVNKSEGIEQGFTLDAPPARRDGVASDEPLLLVVSVEGDLRARAAEDGQAVELNRGGEGVLSYSHLVASDAGGRKLAARMETNAEGDEIALVVDDAGAQYPIVVDPITATLEKKLDADARRQAEARFGFAVAIDSDEAVVGAWRHDAGAGFPDGGAIYLFTRSGTSWSRTGASIFGGVAGTQCGFSVDISGGRIVYGCPGANNGAGIAFYRSASGLETVLPQLSGTEEAGNLYGSSISIYEDTIAVGAPSANTIIGIRGPANVGIVHIFNIDSNDTPQISAQLFPRPENQIANARFGTEVAVDRDRFIAGAPGAGVGFAEVYGLNASNNLTFLSTLRPGDGAPGDNFGNSVALSFDRAVVGAPLNDNERGADAGAAYVFVRGGDGQWTQQQKLTAGDGRAGDFFSEHAVAIEGNTIVVGAYSNGDPLGDNSGNDDDRGAAYVFTRSLNTWTQQAKISQSNFAGGEPGAHFGIDVDLSGKTILIGARGASAEDVVRAGAAFAYRLGCVPPSGSRAVYFAGSFFPSLTACPGQNIFIESTTQNGDNAPFAGLSFQWRKNGVNIPGATSANYGIANVSASDAGTYDVVVSNACGSDISSPFALSVHSFSLNLTSQNFGAAGSNGSLNVTSTGTSCGWTAASNASWITVTSGASGTGNGTVGFTVAANTGAGQRTGTLTIAGQTFTVTQDGTAPVSNTVQFSQSVYSTSEGAGSTTITVTRTGDLSTPVTVEYATTDGTATDRGDYNTTIGRLRFAAGEGAKAFTVLITDDAYAEGTESFTLTLSNPTGSAALGSPLSAAVTISDNDATTSAANPLDATPFFVRQQYVDFFSREPDAPGLAFWSGGIDSCGANAGCREVKRIDTSAAFFLSIEFQETGFLVHRLYRASFGRLSRYREFVRDTQEIGRGVVVNSPGWEAQLEANKAAFISEFAARADFQALYGSMTNAQYVDALNANTNGSLSQAERDSLVAGLNATTETRATALRKVADDADFRARETSPAFVLMQYFGYLRRNPDDAPDADFAGYNFWLGKLNEFGGDYRRAEMVRAFLVSTEYRRRFGQ